MSFYVKLEPTAASIAAEIEKFRIFDCHEHLPSEKGRLSSRPDVFTLFSHYCQHDLYSGGMDLETRRKILWEPGDIDWKWREFEPYYKKMQDTSYTRAAMITMEKFYGESELNARTVHTVTERIQAANRPGLYESVLRGACNIEKALSVDTPFGEEQGIIADLRWIPPEVTSLSGAEKTYGTSQTIDDILEARKKLIDGYVKQGIVGMKTYVMENDAASRAEADEAFTLMKAQPERVFRKANPVNQYLWVETLKYISSIGLPTAIHTGYWNDYRELNPSWLLPIVRKYPDMKLDVFHMGYPYMREALMLAKVWPGVRLNMCWTYIISERFAFDALDEALDLLPDNKLFGFGGDYYVVEKVFGHLVMARETLARVLGARVDAGRMKYDRAVEVAHRMLYDNPKEFYRL